MERRVVDDHAIGCDEHECEHREKFPLDHAAGEQCGKDQSEAAKYLDSGFVNERKAREKIQVHVKEHQGQRGKSARKDPASHAPQCDDLERPGKEGEQQDADPKVVDAKVVQAETESDVANRGKRNEQAERDSARDEDAAVNAGAAPQLRDDQQGKHAHVKSGALEIVHPAVMVVADTEQVLVKEAREFNQDRGAVVQRQHFGQAIAEPCLGPGDPRTVEQSVHQRNRTGKCINKALGKTERSQLPAVAAGRSEAIRAARKRYRTKTPTEKEKWPRIGERDAGIGISQTLQ